MSKLKSSFYCQNCGAQYAKWQGQCNKCNSWNSITEEFIEVSKKSLWDHTKSDLNSTQNTPKPIDEIKIKDEYRIKTNDNEFNRVLGGGIVPGSITLLGGEPGIGKSTLFLQLSLKIKQIVLYVSPAAYVLIKFMI
tara:strand:+ start:192 stop:599 length:408 start_codon:yes stop_codon:yes gene_type:complete